MGVGLREQYGAFNTALQSLYDDDTLLLAEREKTFEFDDAVFDEAVRRVYDLQGFDAEKLADPAIRELITETARILGAAIDKGLVGTLGSSVRGSESKSAPQELPAPMGSVEHEVPETLRYALENNAFTFSGFKTFHCMREVGLSLTNDEGHIKPFAEFLTDVKKINARYNHHYLEAEYNHAVAASQMASRWYDFEQDGDDYNLQYRTAGDDRVREDHAVLHDTTLPPSDPFWDKYFPPNGWNCRCTVVQVRKEKYPVSDPALAMLRGDNCTDGEKKKIFRYNPGKSLELFPPKHPYYKAPKDAKPVIKKVSAEEIRKNRINEIIAELPNNLTSQEKQAIAENCLELEKALGITKGKPMSVDEADKQSANPKFGKQGYNINCQTCSPAYLLRTRGFNLWATNKPKSKIVAYEVWENIDGTKATFIHTNKWMQDKGYKMMTPQRYKQFFNECCKEVGIYEIMITWKGGNRHATNLQRFETGELRYIEPQVDNSKGSQREGRTLGWLCRNLTTKPYVYKGFLDDGVMRIDNKIFDTSFYESFETK